MLTNFENITHELTDKELELIPLLVEGFKGRSKLNPVKAPEVVDKMNRYLKTQTGSIRMSQPRLRKCVNFIRTNAILPLIATSEGYYVSRDKVEIQAQIDSLNQRARSIRQCAEGLKKYMDYKLNYDKNQNDEQRD